MKKIKPLLQMNQTECGLCVVIMLMEHYGVSININDIASLYTVGRNGTSISDMKKIFSHYHFETSIYRVKDSLLKISKESLPCIAYKKLGHFVVIESVSKNNVVILDPSIGRIHICKLDLEQEYENIIVRIQKNKNFTKINSRGNEFRIIKKALFSSKELMLKVSLLAILIYVITLVIPILLKEIVDLFLKYNQINNKIKIISLIILISGFLYIIINKIKLFFSVNLSIVIDKFLTTTVVNKLFKNKFEYFLNRTSSDIQYRLLLLKNMKLIISNIVIQTALDIGSMIVIFIYIYSVNFVYTIILFLLTFFVIIFNVFIRDKMLQYKNSELYNDNKLQILQYDIFRSIFDVKVLGLSITKHKNWNDYYDKYIESHKKSQIFVSNYQNVLSYITIFFPIYISLVGIWIGGILNTNEIGTIISLQSMSGIYISGLVSISQLSDNLTSLKSYIMRIEDILTQDDEKKGTAIINFKGNISVKNLSFHYPGSHDKVINNINFSVSEGESVAIVGESGSGKSTLFYILLGAYDDYSGIIEYEGVDLIKINKDHLREQVGVVPQNSLLFSGTIKENLSQERNYSDKFIYSILKKVSMDVFVKSLAMGLNTIVSENGFNLSGGQKQRIALARAIIKGKPTLFLDEATSSLDNITEKLVINALSEESKTKIVIAHRLGTIKNSDKIIVLKDGFLSEIGNHETLLLKKGEYYRMYCDDTQKI